MTDTTLAAPADYAYGKFIVANRWLVIVASLVAVFAAAYGMQFLQMNPDSRVFFSKDNPQLQALEQFENTYTKDDNLMYVLAPKDGDVFTRETLDAIVWLTKDSWQTPFSNRVDSITNFQHTQADGDDLSVDDMYEGGDDVTQANIEFAREIVMSRPTLVNRLVSDDGRVTAVNVNVILPGTSIAEVPQIAAFGRAKAAEFRERYPNIDLYLVGGTMINMAFSEVPEQDIQTLFPVMIVLILLIIGGGATVDWLDAAYLGFRDFRGRGHQWAHRLAWRCTQRRHHGLANHHIDAGDRARRAHYGHHATADASRPRQTRCDRGILAGEHGAGVHH